MKIKYLLLLIILSGTFIIAQEKPMKGIYLNAFLGAQSSNNGIDRYYNGSTSIFFGSGFGVPVFSNLSLIGRVSYISKSNYDGIADPRYVDHSLNIDNRLVSINASMRQLIFNGGLQYKIYLIEGINLGLLGGLTYAVIDHESTLPNGVIFQQANSEGIFGYFGGANIEKNFEESDFSLYGEAIYNKINSNTLYFRDAFSGMNFTFGFRYYFTNSNK